MKYKRQDYLLFSRNGDNYMMDVRKYNTTPFVGARKSLRIALKFFNGTWYQHLWGKKAATLIDTGNGILVTIRKQEFRMDYAAAEEFLLMMDEYRKTLYRASMAKFGSEPFIKIGVKRAKKAKRQGNP